MRFLFFILLQCCHDCIYYKEPNIIFDIYNKKNGGFCLLYKDYAVLSRINEKKCGYYGKGFNPRFRKLTSQIIP